MTGKTARMPLQTSPKAAAKLVTEKVNKAPTNIRQGRSCNLVFGGAVGFVRGSKYGVAISEQAAISNAMPRLGLVKAKVSAKMNHASSAESKAKIQFKRMHTQE